MNRSFWLVALLVAAVAIQYASAHSYLTSPVSRSDQRSTQTGCRGPACLGPCDAPASRARAPIQIRRGDPIVAKWPRNNHAAGFIRWAWAQTAQSDSHAAFDNNVQLYSCHETGRVAGGACAPTNAALPNGGDSGPPDGSRGACERSLSVPNHLPNGRWTMQWAWFGGAFNLGDYYSCVDYEIVGGPEAPSKAAVQWDGGDFSNPAAGVNGVCKFYNTRSLHVCKNEACFNGEAPGPGKGKPAAVSGGAAPAPIVTATAAPSTPAPTAKPATPGPNTPAPATPAPVPPPSGGSTAGSCSAGVNCNDMSVTFSLTDKWATGMAASVRASVKRAMSSWQLSFKLGSGMKIVSIWNCQLVSAAQNSDGTQTVTVRNPSWQTSVSAGQTLDIGFTANFASGNAPSVNSLGFALSAGTRAEDSTQDSADAAGAHHEEAASSGLSTAAAVGIAVGGAAGVAAMIAGVLIARKKMQANKNRPSPGPEAIQFSHVATESPALSTN